MENPESTFLIARHTKKTKNPAEGSGGSGEFYQGITPEGEQLVREKTREHLLRVIQDAPENAVVAFAGVSNLPRTKSTTRVSISELKSVLAEQSNEYVLLDEADINALVDKKTESTRAVLTKTVAAHPDKKVVLSYPLALKEFSLVMPEHGPGANVPDWKTGGAAEKWSPFLTELMKSAGNNEDVAMRIWLENGGKMKAADGSVVRGPTPTGVAQEYINALRRLERVAKELFPGRPLLIEATAHSWDIDAFITYATHQGKIDVAAYDEIAKGTGEESTFISEFEFPVIKFGKEGGTLEYRGKTYPMNAPEFTDGNPK